MPRTTGQAAPTKKPTLTEQYNSLHEDFEALKNDHQRVQEYMSSALYDLKREDIQWAAHGSSNDYSGFDLSKLKKWSNQIRASYTGSEDGSKAPNPHMRNGFMLRHSFIWDGDIHYSNLPGETPKRGVKNLKAIIEGTVDDGKASANESHRLVFSATARRKREFALYSDGLYLLIGDNNAKTLRPVPLHEITDTHRDKDYEDEIVAYRITRMVAKKDADGRVIGGGEREAKSEWVYVDWYAGVKPSVIKYGASGADEDVLQDKTAFDFHANRPEGQAFGSPDAVAAVVWAKIIRDLIMNGVKMQDALAMFAFKATAPGKDGQAGAALELAKTHEAGSAATLGGDTDFIPLNTAGKGYDFASIGFIVSTMASSLHVSGISLAANTALAGSSYGAAKTLDLPGRMAMEVRRREHEEFDNRLLRWMGSKDATSYFYNYDDATDEYRSVQAAYLLWQSGRITVEKYAELVNEIYGYDVMGPAPEGVLLPNNKKTLTLTKPPVTGAPGQGQSDGTGGKGHVGDAPQSE